MRGKNYAIIFFSILILPVWSMGECTCVPSDVGSNAGTFHFKIAALVSILVASAAGVSLPMVGRIFPPMSPDKDTFFVFKAFAAGVILATAFIHVLPNAFEKLTSPCLSENPWSRFPFTGFISMLAAMGTLMVDAYATSFYSRQLAKAISNEQGDGETEVGTGNEQQVGHVHDQVEVHAHGHVHAHGDLNSNTHLSSSTELLRHRVISRVLELGIIVHSVIIGISLGTSGELETIKPLMAALTFHQFFEGIGLGSTIYQAGFHSKAVVIMSLLFSLTTPVGIAIGIGVSTSYNANSQKALVVEGVMDAASSGILIYMSLVDLLAADFMSTRMQRNAKLQFWSNVSLLFGAGSMSFLAKWA